MTKVNKTRQSQKVKTKLDINAKLLINVIFISILFISGAISLKGISFLICIIILQFVFIENLGI